VVSGCACHQTRRATVIALHPRWCAKLLALVSDTFVDNMRRRAWYTVRPVGSTYWLRPVSPRRSSLYYVDDQLQLAGIMQLAHVHSGGINAVQGYVVGIVGT
jgi:hypothetical protein